MGKKGSTGASAGRLGGRLAAGKRLKNRLRRLPTVKVIDKAEKNKKKKRKEQAAAASAPMVSASLMAIANSIADALKLTPRRKDLVLLGASAGYAAHQAIVQESAPGGSGSSAAAGLQQQQPQQAQKAFSTPAEAAPPPHGKTRASSSLVTELQRTKKQKQEQAEAAQRARSASEGAGSSSDPLPPVLGQGRRGEQLVVQAKSSYGANKTYFWADVVDVCRRIEDKNDPLKKVDLDLEDEHGQPFFKVPRNSAVKWLKDDHDVMRSKTPPQRGVSGTSHWRVELEVRGRTSLDKPGPDTVLGQAAEDKLMLEICESARMGWAYVMLASNSAHSLLGASPPARRGSLRRLKSHALSSPALPIPSTHHLSIGLLHALFSHVALPQQR